MVNIDIRCPKCSRKRILTLSEKEIKFKPNGLFSINVVKDFTCEHSYVAYIDKHYTIRDYFDFDYNIELPEITTTQVKEQIIEDNGINFDVDLVKLNLTPNVLTIIFKAILSKKPCIFIKDKDLLFDFLIPFFEMINENSFEFDLQIIDEETYRNSKSKFKKYLILNNIAILSNPFKFIDIKKLKVEKRIINAFMVELNALEGLKVLRKHIKNAFDLAVLITTYISNQGIEKHIYTKNLLDYLENTHGITISSQYLDFLIEIVYYYFEIQVKLSIPHYTGVF